MDLQFKKLRDFSRFSGQIIMISRVANLRQTFREMRTRTSPKFSQMFSRHVRSLSANASNLQNIPEADRKDSSNGEKELVSEPTNIISENCIDGIGPKSLHRVAIQIDSLKLPSAETSRLCRLILTLKGHAPLFTPNVTMYPPTSPLKELGCALPPNKTNQSAFSNPSLASPTIAMNSINIGTIFSLHLAGGRNQNKIKDRDKIIDSNLITLNIEGNEGKFEIVVEMKEKHYADAVWKQVATTGDVSFSQFFPGFASSLNVPLIPPENMRQQKVLSPSSPPHTTGELNLKIARTISIFSFFELAEAADPSVFRKSTEEMKWSPPCFLCGERTRVLNHFSGWACSSCGSLHNPVLGNFGGCRSSLVPLCLWEQREGQDSRVAFNADRLDHAVQHIAFGVKELGLDSYNNLHSLMNWRTPHRSLAAVTAWLFVVWNLHWTTLLLLILLTYLVSTFTAYHLMRGIMRWEKGMYSTNFIEKYVSAYIKAPDDKEVDSNGTQLDSVRTETISLQSKSGEYVQRQVPGLIIDAKISITVNRAVTDEKELWGFESRKVWIQGVTSSR